MVSGNDYIATLAVLVCVHTDSMNLTYDITIFPTHNLAADNSICLAGHIDSAIVRFNRHSIC